MYMKIYHRTMSFNPGITKQVQQIIFSQEKNETQVYTSLHRSTI